MPHVITLDKIYVKSLEIFRRQIPVETGEFDSNGFPIITHEQEWALRVKYDMLNDQGSRKNGETIYSMDEAHENAIKNFMKPFIQELKAGLDIQEGEDWAT